MARSDNADAKRPMDVQEQARVEAEMNALMIVASLLSTISFQFGVNPPDLPDSPDSHDEWFTPSARSLIYCTICFTISMSVIMVRILGLPLRPGRLIVFLRGAIGVATFFGAMAYRTATTALAQQRNEANSVSGTAITVLMVTCAILTGLFLVIPSWNRSPGA